MTPIAKLMELLNGSGEVRHLEPLGDRHVLAHLWDGTQLLVAAEGVS